MLSFDNTTLVSNEISEVYSRTNCDTSSILGKLKLKIPIICSPMPDVCDFKVANTMAKNGVLSIIHRFMNIDEQIYQWNSVLYKNFIGCAIGINGDFMERFTELYNLSCRIFCVDTANGANIRVKNAIEQIKSKHDDIFIISGNVFTAEGFKFLENCGCDAIRVGIAGGTACTTRVETGMYLPTLEVVHRIVKVREKSFIIADGGIRIPSDMCKAIVIGADAVMCGSIFASCKDSPAKTVKINDRLHKIYRGAASFSIQYEYKNEKPKYVEGDEILLPYNNLSIEDVLFRFQRGLQSSMSYANATCLEQYRKNVKIESL